MKYYHCLNASLPIAGIAFTPYGTYGGALYGTHATEDPKEIETLDNFIAAKPAGTCQVSVIDKAEYDLTEKKTPRNGGISLGSDSQRNPLTEGAKSPEAPSSAAPAKHLPTLEEYVKAGYKAENYDKFIAHETAEPIKGDGNTTVVETPAPASAEEAPVTKPSEVLHTGKVHKGRSKS